MHYGYAILFIIIIMLFVNIVIDTIDEISISDIIYRFKYCNRKYKTSLIEAYEELKTTRKRLMNAKQNKKTKRAIEEIEKSMALISKLLTYKGRVNKDKIINDLADIIASYHSKY